MQWYPWRSAQCTMRTYSDAGWAGCEQTRKSTTGGRITIGAHSIKSWSRIQSLIAFSSGDSELYVSFKAAAETLGILSMAKDLGWSLKSEVRGDAGAALGIIHRKGLGLTRHIQTGYPWIQQTAAEQGLKFHKVLGHKIRQILSQSTSTRAPISDILTSWPKAEPKKLLNCTYSAEPNITSHSTMRITRGGGKRECNLKCQNEEDAEVNSIQ